MRKKGQTDISSGEIPRPNAPFARTSRSVLVLARSLEISRLDPGRGFTIGSLGALARCTPQIRPKEIEEIGLDG